MSLISATTYYQSYAYSSPISFISVPQQSSQPQPVIRQVSSASTTCSYCYYLSQGCVCQQIVSRSPPVFSNPSLIPGRAPNPNPNPIPIAVSSPYEEQTPSSGFGAYLAESETTAASYLPYSSSYILVTAQDPDYDKRCSADPPAPPSAPAATVQDHPQVSAAAPHASQHSEMVSYQSII